MAKQAVSFKFYPGAQHAIRTLPAAQAATDKAAATIAAEVQRLANAKSTSGNVGGIAVLGLDKRANREAASVAVTGHARNLDRRHHLLLKAIKAARL